MVEILEVKDDIIKVLFWINLVVLVVAIFFSSKKFFIIATCINIVLNGSFMVIKKWSGIFMPQLKLFKKMDGYLNKAHGLGRK